MIYRTKASPTVQTILLCAVCLVPIGAAHADVTISAAQTRNVNCSAGVCVPTASDATLNATDLENLLSSGNVEIMTTGSDVQADNIEINSPLNWTGAATLGLDAYQSIVINKTISVSGQGGLALTTNDGGNNGALSFGRKGNAVFEDVSSRLTINGAAFTLVNSI